VYVDRDIEEVFDKLSRVYSIVAIVGARQAGKTTFLKKRLEKVPKSGYVTFDDPDVRDLFNEDIKI
jgi:predicted AAA+ superfamily ATPase